MLPVIMLTAKTTEYDRIKGLDTGADDYIAKPFSILELVSRIKAVLRRTGEIQPQRVMQIDEIAIDPKKHTVEINGNEVALTYKEFELLHFLMQHENAAMSREQILAHIWGYEYDGCTNRTVDMHIKTLRRKLGDSGEKIKTIRGLGYKIVNIDS